MYRSTAKLWNLPLHLFRQQLDWLKGLQNDRCSEEAAAAKEQCDQEEGGEELFLGKKGIRRSPEDIIRSYAVV